MFFLFFYVVNKTNDLNNFHDCLIFESLNHMVAQMSQTYSGS